MLSFFLNILKQKCGSYVCVQLLQTLNILFENIRNETSLCKYPLPIYDSFFFLQYILSVDITINFHFIYQWSRGGKKAWFLVMGKKVQRLFFPPWEILIQNLLYHLVFRLPAQQQPCKLHHCSQVWLLWRRSHGILHFFLEDAVSQIEHSHNSLLL